MIGSTDEWAGDRLAAVVPFLEIASSGTTSSLSSIEGESALRGTNCHLLTGAQSGQHLGVAVVAGSGLDLPWRAFAVGHDDDRGRPRSSGRSCWRGGRCGLSWRGD